MVSSFPKLAKALALACAGLIAALLRPPPASAQPVAPASDDAELRALTESLAHDAAKPHGQDPADPRLGHRGSAAAANPDIALVLDVAAAWFDGEPAQTGAHDPQRTGFNLQQLELYLGASVDPYFRLDANLVFAQFGVEVEEAYATTLALPWGLQARVGQMLTRFGRFNATHPHSWSFVDQPLVIGKFMGAEGARGLGAEVSWLAPLPWYVELVAWVGQADGACCARSFFGADDLGVEGVEDLRTSLALKQFVDLGADWALLLGASTELGPNATGRGNRSAIVGGDLTIRFRPRSSTSRSHLTLLVEGLYRSRQVPGDALRDWGGFAQLVWGITPRWEVGARYEQVSGLSDDPLDPAWTSTRRRTSLQLTAYPSHFSRLRLQANHDDPMWRSDPIWAVVAALEVTIGARGAHAY